MAKKRKPAEPQKLYKGRKRNNPNRCPECGHSLDLHDGNGCRVNRLPSGDKCDCSVRMRR
jgi:hypothetical protein